MTTIDVASGAVYLISPDDRKWWEDRIAEFGAEAGEFEDPVDGEIGRIEGIRIVILDFPLTPKEPESRPAVGRPWYRRGRR